NGFTGLPLIDPQIDYKGAVDASRFMTDGKGQVYLNATVNDDKGNKIGTLKTVLRVAAQANNGVDSNVMLYASSADSGFFGGLPQSAEGVFDSGELIRLHALCSRALLKPGVITEQRTLPVMLVSLILVP
ncbi:hypothetical protein MJL09_22310, partial [Salmonella enterica subsp. enterica serovar Cerro]|nr:hypothetical protein [Salmonella enterica subsp. enterica serovar Cerro]